MWDGFRERVLRRYGEGVAFAALFEVVTLIFMVVLLWVPKFRLLEELLPGWSLATVLGTLTILGFVLGMSPYGKVGETRIKNRPTLTTILGMVIVLGSAVMVYLLPKYENLDVVVFFSGLIVLVWGAFDPISE